jgi:hypothetical protein
MTPGFDPVTDKTVSDMMKFGSAASGLDPRKVSAHSLRYGGATMLAASGLPQYLICWYGGWKEDSATMRLYSTIGQEAVGMVSEVMSRQSGTGLADVLIKQTIRAKMSRGAFVA